MKLSSAKKHGTINLEAINKLIHEPSRLIIVSLLYVLDSADFLFIMNQTGMTQGNLSSHMSKLERAAYIEVKKDFVNKRPHTMLKLSRKGKIEFENYCNIMREFFINLTG